LIILNKVMFMKEIPQLKSFDSTRALMKDPFLFISKNSQAAGSDIYKIKLLGLSAICMTGAEAESLFYQQEFFVPLSAGPKSLRATLFGAGIFEQLDGEVHPSRQAMYEAIYSQENIAKLTGIFEKNLFKFSVKWERTPELICLYSELKKILLKSAALWIGVPLDPSNLDQKVKDLSMIFEDSGRASKVIALGLSRVMTGRWLLGVVEEIRAGKTFPPAGSAADILTRHQDGEGKLLTNQAVAHELLRILSSTTALALSTVKALHAYHTHPEARKYLEHATEYQLESFVNEVFRYYPSTAPLMAKVKSDFEYRGFKFEKDTRVLLDSYGAAHDYRKWEMPYEFRADRFEGLDQESLLNGTRGPGWMLNFDLSLSVLKAAMDFFLKGITYDLPLQDLTIDFKHPPGFIASGIRVSQVEMVYSYTPVLHFKASKEERGFLAH
jgi:fatty-acid peroxygenase